LSEAFLTISQGFGRVSELLSADGGAQDKTISEGALLSSMLSKEATRMASNDETNVAGTNGNAALSSSTVATVPKATPKKKPTRKLEGTAESTAESATEASATQQSVASTLGTPAKDPNAPKKPLHAFFAYMRDERPRQKAAHPELAHPELVHLIKQNWDAADKEVRAKYEKEAESARLQYQQVKSDYDSKKLKEDEGEAQETAIEPESAEANVPEKKQRKKRTAEGVVADTDAESEPAPQAPRIDMPASQLEDTPAMEMPAEPASKKKKKHREQNTVATLTPSQA